MRETVGVKTFRVVTIAFLILFVGVPLFVMATSSLRPLSDGQSLFTPIPSRLTVEPFFAIWPTVSWADYFVDSLIISLAATVFCVLVAVLAAYAMSGRSVCGSTSARPTATRTRSWPRSVRRGRFGRSMDDLSEPSHSLRTVSPGQEQR